MFISQISFFFTIYSNIKEPVPDHKFLFDIDSKNGEYCVNSQTFEHKNLGSETEGLGESAIWFVVKSLKLNQGSKVFFFYIQVFYIKEKN